jgi:hypothetical protein
MNIRLSRARSTSEVRDTDTITLIYELLDAHQDTAEIAQALCDDPKWAAHLDYLRALQRTGREMLARMPAGERDERGERGERDGRDEARR